MSAMTAMSPMTAPVAPFRARGTVEVRAAAPAGVTRLTRRGRLLLTTLVLALLVLGAVAGATRSVAGAPGSGPAVRTVVVQPGQSLWAFAAEAMPGVDTREAVLRLKELNDLPSSVIHPGQTLVVPAA